jgi:LacI family transcriptional regulator
VPATKGAKIVRVALVLPTEYAYARGVMRGIIAATRERNLYASGLPRRSGPERLPWMFNVYRGIYGHASKYLARWFEDWNPDGIISQIYDDRLAGVYREANKPVVELFESRAESEFPRILPDDVATGELAGRHFLERGFRHFGFFGAPHLLWSREREIGFRLEIERAFRSRAQSSGDESMARNFTFASYGAHDRKMSAVLGASQERRRAAMGDWIASLPRPLAVFAANDLWGSELIQAARERGLRVPGDVAIVGVDNEELLCEISHPPLSSIRIGSEQIGRTAVAMLEQLLRGKRPAEPIARIAPVEVVTRQSSDVLAVEDEIVAEALQHIRQHAVEGLSVKQLLEAVPVNRRTLERRFIGVVGHTPLEEIQRVRIARAKVLLQTELPIYEVASGSGFATPEYLATSFLRATGLTPTAYRRQFGPGNRQRLPVAVGN